MSSSGHIKRVLTIFQDSLDAGRFYEAHQACRSAGRRLVAQKKYPQACELLFTTAKLLLERGQEGSGVDIATYLVDVYAVSGAPVDATSVGRLIDILAIIDIANPARKPFIQKVVTWSAKAGGTPKGSPQIHHYVGLQDWNGGALEDAEKHLFLGTPASAKALGLLLAAKRTADVTLSPGAIVIPTLLQYLAIGNLRDARLMYTSFLCDAAPTTLPETAAYKPRPDAEVAEEVVLYEDTLLNFGMALLSSVGREARDVYILLREHVKKELATLPSPASQHLAIVAERYFGIAKPSTGPSPMSLLSGLFGGAAGGAGASRALPF